MNPIAKGSILIGVLLILFGLIYQFVGKWIPLGKLPGDIVIEKENMKVYFPIVTCIVISVILSLLGYFFRFFR